MHGGDPNPPRDRRQNPVAEDQQGAAEAGSGQDERLGERQGLLTLASQILISTAHTVRALVVIAAVVALATGAILATGITRVDIGPVHITIRDTPAQQ